MCVVDLWHMATYSFPSVSSYSKLKAVPFANSLSYQLSKYPFPSQSDFGSNVTRNIGVKWFERIPGRWIPQSKSPSSSVPSPTDSITTALSRFSFSSTASVEVQYVGNSNTIKKPGWTVASEICAVEEPTAYSTVPPIRSPRSPQGRRPLPSPMFRARIRGRVRVRVRG